MAALTREDRTFLELLSKGAMTESEISERLSRGKFQELKEVPEERLNEERQKIIEQKLQDLRDYVKVTGTTVATPGFAPGGRVISLSPQGNAATSLSIHYLSLLNAMGVVGFLLPLILLVGKILVDKLLHSATGLPGSISAYYYTAMRNVFVGGICAIAVFLVSYKGWDNDYIWTRWAGVFAILVALFPTKPDIVNPTQLQRSIGLVHLISAAAFFSLLAIICLRLFTKTSAPGGDLRGSQYVGKRHRNALYKTCGLIIVGCIVLIVLKAVLPASAFIEQLKPLFWLEWGALWAFGLAWIIKGEGLIRLLARVHIGVFMDKQPEPSNQQTYSRGTSP